MMSNIYEKDVIPEIKLRVEVVTSHINTRGNTKKIYQRRSNKEVERNAFLSRASKVWNALPKEVISATNVNTFKNRLDRYWKNQSMKYDSTVHSIL